MPSQFSVFCRGVYMSLTPATSTPKASSIDAGRELPTIVINTRPAERATALTQRLMDAGMSVVEMPMLALKPRLSTDADKALMGQWLAGEYQALVVISPTAAELGMAAWQSLRDNIRHNALQDSHNRQGGFYDSRAQSDEHLKAPSQLIAVGQATATALTQTKPDTVRCPIRQPEIASNEGMLAMPEIKQLQAGDKLLIWRGLGGRRLLVDALQARGVHIDSIAWYERSIPDDAVRQYQQWQDSFFTGTHADTDAAQVTASSGRVKPSIRPIVIVSSGAAFENWVQVVDRAPSRKLGQSSIDTTTGDQHEFRLGLDDFSYVVLGERLANIVAAQQLSYWRVDDLAPETILSVIAPHA